MQLATARPRVRVAGRSVPARRRPRRQRDEWVTTHLPLVTQIAAKLCAKLPRQVEIDELVSAGHVGLVEAADAFDPVRGVAFGAFARRRILGAMLDHLRAVDPLSRDDRARVRRGDLAHFEVQLHLDDPIHVRAHGLDALMCSGQAPDATAADQLRAATIRRALARLPDRERYVLEQYFWHDRKLVDIGEDLGISLPMASRLKTRGCAMLQRLLTC